MEDKDQVEVEDQVEDEDQVEVEDKVGKLVWDQEVGVSAQPVGKERFTSEVICHVPEQFTVNTRLASGAWRSWRSRTSARGRRRPSSR